jgi:integrase
MASINFRTKGKNKPNASVYITFRNGRKCSLEIKSGITIPNSDWLTKPDHKGNTKRKGEHRTRNIAAFKDQLDVQKKLDGLGSALTKELSKTSDYSKEWLQGVVNKFHGITDEVEETEPTLSEMMVRYVEHILNAEENPCTPSTAKSYMATKARIEKFDAHKNHVHSVSEIGANYKSEFMQWARTVEQYARASYQKSAKQIKTVITYCREIGFDVDEGLLQKNTRRKGGVKQVENLKQPLYISLDEIDRLMAFTGPDYLENARDWLVISCWTACRVSDLTNLTMENVEITIHGDNAIRYLQKKTQKEVTTPYHLHVDQIIKRNGGAFPRKISDQKYNKYIKELCKEIGMTEMVEGEKKMKTDVNGEKKVRAVKGIYPKNELIVSHIGRRSFASNHYGKMPNHTIMLVTGHTTEGQFLAYVGKPRQDHVSKYNAFYSQETGKTTASI